MIQNLCKQVMFHSGSDAADSAADEPKNSFFEEMLEI